MGLWLWPGLRLANAVGLFSIVDQVQFSGVTNGGQREGGGLPPGAAVEEAQNSLGTI